MKARLSKLPTIVGSRLLPFTNPRVVSPPGRLVANGNQNILVATPKRSGTHVLIDMILNNIPAYCRQPLYVDLDQCLKGTYRGQSGAEQIAPNAGYVIKTHIPFETDPAFLSSPEVHSLFGDALVVTVRRDENAVTQSLTRWRSEDTARHAPPQDDQSFTEFWDFWGPRQHMEIPFDHLFLPEEMRQVLNWIGKETGTTPRRKFTGPPPRNQKMMIHAHKTLTRLLGYRAPRIDTTIHTLKG